MSDISVSHEFGPFDGNGMIDCNRPFLPYAEDVDNVRFGRDDVVWDDPARMSVFRRFLREVSQAKKPSSYVAMYAHVRRMSPRAPGEFEPWPRNSKWTRRDQTGKLRADESHYRAPSEYIDVNFSVNIQVNLYT